MLDPRAGRARIVRDADKLIVSIKGKRHPFVAAFLGFWLLAWAFGWIAASGSLLLGGAGGASLFILVWLCGWTVGGILALAAFLWLVSGRETIEISADKVSIIRHIPIWSKKVECHFADIKRLRVQETTTGLSGNQTPNWFSRKSGNIQLDYGIHSLGFGIELDQAEAAQVVHTILAVFPELGSDAARPNT